MLCSVNEVPHLAFFCTIHRKLKDIKPSKSTIEDDDDGSFEIAPGPPTVDNDSDDEPVLKKPRAATEYNFKTEGAPSPSGKAGRANTFDIADKADRKPKVERPLGPDSGWCWRRMHVCTYGAGRIELTRQHLQPTYPPSTPAMLRHCRSSGNLFARLPRWYHEHAHQRTLRMSRYCCVYLLPESVAVASTFSRLGTQETLQLMEQRPRLEHFVHLRIQECTRNAIMAGPGRNVLTCFAFRPERSYEL